MSSFVPVLSLLALLTVAPSAFACRVVCGEGADLWHLFGSEDDETFVLLWGPNEELKGFRCTMPATLSKGAEAQEEQRLVNHCVKESAEERVVLRTELVERRVMDPEKATDVRVQEMAWVLETARKDGPVSTRRQVFARKDCGSAEER
jgi:hypothetical protein